MLRAWNQVKDSAAIAAAPYPLRSAPPARYACALTAVLLVTACGSEPEVREAPYVLKQGCEFTLQASADNSTSTTIEKGNTMVTLTLSMGGFRVGVSDCQVVDNPQGLPVYED